MSLKLNSNSINYNVATVLDLTSIVNPSINDTVVVTEEGRGGVFIYRADGTSNGGTIFDSSGAGKWHRQYEGSVNVKWFGAKGDGVTDDTLAIQNCIDTVWLYGGGSIYLSNGVYLLSESNLNEIYENEGVELSSNDLCLVVRENVSLIGDGIKNTHLHCADSTKTILGLLEVNNITIRDMEISSSWSKSNNTGAGHGLFSLYKGNILTRPDLIGNTFKNLFIHNVGSYGIGLQNGSPINTTISNITIDTIGADGLDLKARGTNYYPSGNNIYDVVISSHGGRVDGSAGIDIRGIWNIYGVSVHTAFNDEFNKVGVRFRTFQPPTPHYPQGDFSTLQGFYIDGSGQTESTDSINFQGIVIGSTNVSVSNGSCRDCYYGASIIGNLNGVPDKTAISNVNVINAKKYGFYISTGNTNTIISNCTSTGALTAGLRNEGISTTISNFNSINDAVGKSTSTAASTTEVILGSRLGDSTLSNVFITTNRVGIAAVGNNADIDIVIAPKGTGTLRYGTHTTTTDVATTGYITIRDSSGVTRKLAVIS